MPDFVDEPISPIEVRVNLTERAYSIWIGSDLENEYARQIQAVLPKVNHCVCIYDANVSSQKRAVVGPLEKAGIRISQLEVASGEASKSVEEAARLWQSMLAERTDRGSAVIAIGGGVVGDLAGFMAATFARGIPLVQIPTTLLSQVDSSVGGKTGINLPGAKNIVGAFWQPSSVLISTHSLQTLPDREYISGLAEVAKYGVILLPELFHYLEKNASEVLRKSSSHLMHIIAESCKAKAMVVEEDERETSGRRAILNYGHTFAHALESVSGYGTLLHGEAVSIGMHMAAILAEKLGRVTPGFVLQQKQLLEKLKLPTSFPEADPQEMWKVMQHDKKVEHGKLRFILPSKLGHVELVPGVEEAVAIDSIHQANSGS